ncbi:MAG TPA: efflux RND transporter periplasmic adaptor subunit [Vicinamibacteria bacterium]|nr:efflux RND transporter periplasmic adaptor subunit [Vicinamibacteria bacterium]
MGRASIAFVLAAVAVAPGCRGSGGSQGPGGFPVKIEVARSVSVADSTEYVATIKSRASAAIRPEVEGKITEIFVRPGTRVAAGAPLMQIDPAKQQATLKSQQDTLAAKRASVEYARQQHVRVKGLAASGITSQQDLDQAKAALDASQAELEALEAQVREQQVQLHYYTVAAPTAGVVGDIPGRVGDRVTADTTLTTIDQAGGLEAYVSVPVERAPQLHPGQAVQILDAAGQVLADTRLSFVSPQVDEATQTVLVKAKIDAAEGLRPSQFTRARLIWGTHEGPVVPVLAVSRISGRHFAFVAEEDKGALVARQKPLRVGDIVDGAYVVLEGLKAGDRVIVSGTQLLFDGAPVSPQG